MSNNKKLPPVLFKKRCCYTTKELVIFFLCQLTVSSLEIIFVYEAGGTL